jgi:Nif11 domain
MTQISSVSEFLTATKQDENLHERLRAATTVRRCIELAESYGYKFSSEEFIAELDRLSDETVAKLVNPGVAPRRHIKPH